MQKVTSTGRPTGQYTQAVRLFQLFQRLEASPEGVRIEELAREMNVTARSIRRDLKALTAAEQSIETVTFDGERRVRLARTGRSMEPIRMTRFQRYSLAAIRRAFDALAGTPLHDDLSQLFAKLVPKEIVDHGVMAERFLYIPEAPKNYKRIKDQVYQVYDGVLRNLTLQFAYDGGSTPGMRKLEPYALVLYRNGLYVVGRDVVKKEPRTFAVERMRRVRALSNAPFERDPTLDVSKMFEGAFGLHSAKDRRHVVVDFEEKVSTFVEERVWHNSQKIVKTADGVRIELDVSINEELVGWVLRWGRSARVIEPQELIDRVRAEYSNALSQYTSDTASTAPAATQSAGHVARAS